MRDRINYVFQFSYYSGVEELIEVMDEVVYQSNLPDFVEYANSPLAIETLGNQKKIDLPVPKNLTYEDRRKPKKNGI